MRKVFNKVEGDIGEFYAQKYLKDKGYKILEVNFKVKIGEIDIIAQQKDVIVFVEVKRRETLMFGRPSEAVDWKKQRNIKNVAQIYLMRKKLLDNPIRFDIIEIVGEQINHIENAF